MKIGDVVVNKWAWKWLEFNPWMKGNKFLDDKIGIVINKCTKRNSQKIPTNCEVLWSNGNFDKNVKIVNLKVLNED